MDAGNQSGKMILFPLAIGDILQYDTRLAANLSVLLGLTFGLRIWASHLGLTFGERTPHMG